MGLTLVFLSALGIIVGSFLNVVGLRFRTGRGLGGRSSCPSCGKVLSAVELVPVLSFLIQRGRCKNCGAKISWQYALIELWSGFLFVSLYYIFGFTLLYALSLIVFCLFTVILIYDLHHKIIPDEFAYASIIVALVFRFLAGGGTLNWIIGPILFALFGLGWLISQGRALGFGDAKLALAIGLLLGGANGISAIILAFWIGTAIMVPLMLFSKKGITMKSEVPFAPFMIVGAWAALYFDLDLLHVLSLIR